MIGVRWSWYRAKQRLRQRPVWLTLFSGAELAAWGIYVLHMSTPLSHATAFRLLSVVPDLNLSVGAWALTVGLLHCVSLPLTARPVQALCDLACLYTWCALTSISLTSPAQHPGITLYAMAAAANAFDLAWLTYDWVRRR